MTFFLFTQLFVVNLSMLALLVTHSTAGALCANRIYSSIKLPNIMLSCFLFRPNNYSTDSTREVRITYSTTSIRLGTIRTAVRYYKLEKPIDQKMTTHFCPFQVRIVTERKLTVEASYLRSPPIRFKHLSFTLSLATCVRTFGFFFNAIKEDFQIY